MTDLADSRSAVGMLQRTTIDLQQSFDIAWRTLQRDAAEVGEDVERALHLVQGIGLLVTGLVDGQAVRFAERGGDTDLNTVYERAYQLVLGLGDEPVGLETGSDPENFARMQRCAANILTRLWLTGYLLGPIPIDAWPNKAIARQLLTTIEQHADAITLEYEIEHFGDDEP